MGSCTGPIGKTLVERLDEMANGWLCAGLHDADLPAEAAREIERLRAALQRVARWHGEFPDSCRQWPDGQPMSYAAAFGSNGERDYMRQIALNALGPNVQAHLTARQGGSGAARS